jgi:serine/threonine protein kinase
LAGASEEYQREGIDFLRALLNPDPAKRLTAEQALDHPFLTHDFDSVAPDSMPPAIKKPILVDNTLTRAVRKACQKMWDKKDAGEEEEESDEEEESEEGNDGGEASKEERDREEEASGEESVDELKV